MCGIINIYLKIKIIGPCEELQLSSSEGARQHQSVTLGLYVKENYLVNGKIVYKHKEREWFLYYFDVNKDDGYWMVRNITRHCCVLKLNNFPKLMIIIWSTQSNILFLRWDRRQESIMEQ